MRAIPVIDLKEGLVVRGIAGKRQAYRPVESDLVASAAPGAVAAALAQIFNAAELYVADLDALAGGQSDWNSYRQIAACGAALWIDAGVASLDQALRLTEFAAAEGFAAQVILGLESAPDAGFLRAAVDALGPSRLIFSLDLRDGEPMTQGAGWKGMSPDTIAHEAAKAGIRRMIVLDVAQVGTGRGLSTLTLCRRLFATLPQIELISGGGVRSIHDLRELAQAGCSAALVASALHDGRISPSDLRSLNEAIDE